MSLSTICLLYRLIGPKSNPGVTIVSGIGEVVKVADSHFCGWGSIPNKSCSVLIVSLSKGLSQRFMCSDQHVKYRMLVGFPRLAVCYWITM